MSTNRPFKEFVEQVAITWRKPGSRALNFVPRPDNGTGMSRGSVQALRNKHMIVPGDCTISKWAAYLWITFHKVALDGLKTHQDRKLSKWLDAWIAERQLTNLQLFQTALLTLAKKDRAAQRLIRATAHPNFDVGRVHDPSPAQDTEGSALLSEQDWRSLAGDLAPPTVSEHYVGAGGSGCYARFRRETLIAIQKPSVDVVWGEPGSGKTTLLASLVGHPAVRKRFGDRIYWCDCLHEHRLEAVLRRVLHPASISGLGKARVLFVFDNAELLIPQLAGNATAVSGAVLELVAKVRGAGPERRCRISCIFLTRERWDVLRVRARKIPPLEIADAQALFWALVNSAPHRSNAFSRADAPVLADLCRDVRCLPLAIKLLSGLVDLSLPSIRDALKESVSVLKEQTPIGDDPRRHWSLEACFQLSFQRLSHDARRLLMCMSVPPDGVSSSFVAPLSRTRDWQQHIGACTDLCLLEHSSGTPTATDTSGCGHDRYRFHPLIRQYALNQFRPEEKRFWQSNFVDYFATSVLDRNTTRGKISDSKRQLLAAEWRNALEAVNLAGALGLHDRVADMPEYFSDFLLIRGLLDERRMLNERMIAAAIATRDRAREGRNLVLLGRVLIDLGEWQSAIANFLKGYRIAREIRRAATANLTRAACHDESEALLNIGIVAARLRRWRLGTRAVRKSMVFPQSPAHRAESLTWLGHHLDRLGYFEEAKKCHSECMQLQTMSGVTSVYVGIAALHRAIHDYLQELWAPAEEILVPLAAHYANSNGGMRASVLFWLGNVRLAQKNIASAKSCFLEAARISDVRKDRSLQAECLLKLGSCAACEQDHAGAKLRLAEAATLLSRSNSEDVDLRAQIIASQNELATTSRRGARSS